MSITIHSGATDDGTPYLRAAAPGFATIHAYQSGDFWAAGLPGERRIYDTEAGWRLGIAAAIRRAARDVQPVNSILLAALSDIASGHNDPRTRATEALDEIFGEAGL